MDSLTSESTLEFAAKAASNGFFFMSPWRSLAARGCFTTITTPACRGDDLDGEFQQTIRQRFSQAKSQGIARPVLVGAIPFDVSQPSSLFIPESSHYFDAKAFLQQMSAPSTERPKVVRRQALPEQDEFMQMVSKAVAATGSRRLDKVVLSRLMEIVTAGPVESGDLMMRLITQNPGSYNFHLSLPQGGSLLGASPELLLRKSGDRYYTHPLAGSARRERDPEKDHLAGWQLMNSDKDRYEHKLVTDAMREVLQPRSADLVLPATPQLLSTATLWHLGTAIEGVVSNKADSALSMACLLHPTPALSGFPHTCAQRLIGELEPFRRGLFGGIVGWCDEHGNGEWAVTIRCGKVNGNRVQLFAGAGIVPASSPESEWRETGVKLNTMLSALGLN